MNRSAARSAPWIARVPEPFAIAILLLVVAWVASAWSDATRGGSTPALGLAGLARAFFAGMWEKDQLAFAFQIAGVLVFGHAAAEAPAVRRVLTRAASLPKAYPSAVALTAIVSMGLASITWGLGLVGGAIFARAVADRLKEKGEDVDEALIAAAGYLGLATWHGGFSGSAPLAVARPFDPARAAPLAGLPLTETVLSERNLFVGLALFVVVPAYLAWRARTGAAALQAVGVEAETRPSTPPVVAPPSPTGRGRVASWALVASLFVGLVSIVAVRGVGAVDLDFVLGASLLVGLALHGSTTAYAAAFDRAVPSAAGVLLQFPIYFGIAALARESGLLDSVLASFKAAIGGMETMLPREAAARVSTFLSAATLNLFVPSGGGQWAVQGPVVAATARDLGIAPGPLVLAFAYGDQCTNLLQPFWALPLLAITRVRAGALLARTAPLCLLTAVLFLIGVAL